MEVRTEGAEQTNERFQRQYDWDSTAPSVAVIETLAVLKDVDSVNLADELDTTLYDHLDPEGLNTLVQENNVSVSFNMGKFRIELEADSLTISQA